jgi:PAS domain S-box-containing protein
MMQTKTPPDDPHHQLLRLARMIQLWVISLLRERALQRSEQRFRDVAESAGDWIWEMNADLRFTYLSPRFYEILRIPPESILGKTRGELAAAEFDAEAWRAHEAKLVARLPFRDFAYIARTSDGQTRHLKIHGKPIFEPDGTFKGYRGTGYDVTEQVELKEALERSQRLLFDAIETIPEGFSLYDEQDRLVVFNSKYRSMLYPGADIQLKAGMSFEAIARQAAQKGFVPEARGRIEEWVKQRLSLRRDQSDPHIQRREDDRWLLVSEHRTRDGGTVALYSDITEIKQREKELANKTKALEQLSGQLAKYLSPQVYESIFTGRREVKIASQRKKLTVFFSDIAGFTEVADRLESEELTQLLNQYLTEMSRIALSYGATIDKYIGDGIVIFFGDPETLGVKKDALSCVKMAIAMQDRMQSLGQAWRNEGLECPSS